MLGYIDKSFQGLVLRSSWLFLYNSKQQLVGCFGVHINIVVVKMVMSFLEDLCRPGNPEDDLESSAGAIETDNIQGYVSSTVDALMHRQLGMRAFSTAEKHGKIALIAELDHKGIFAVKAAINLVASNINMTKFANYNYLDEIRASDPQNKPQDFV